MCLGIPMELVACEGAVGVAEVDGVRREVSLLLLPEPANVGDFVLVHAGFAITRLDRVEAAESLALLREVLAAGEAEEREEGR